MTDRIDILKDWFQTIWIEARLERIEDFFLPRAGADGLMADGQVGPEDFRVLVPALLALVREPAITIDRWHEDADWLWAHTTVHALSARDMKPVSAVGHVMLRFEGERIAEAYNAFDFLTFFTQVGLLPQDAFLLLLGGETLG
jgi:hypothetical protein